jgi:hypothetical protein
VNPAHCRSILRIYPSLSAASPLRRPPGSMERPARGGRHPLAGPQGGRPGLRLQPDPVPPGNSIVSLTCPLVCAAGAVMVADQVLLKIACLLMRWLFGLTVLGFRGDRAKSAELLVLRHENAVGVTI